MLTARFRSGSAALGVELARLAGGMESVLEEDGNFIKKSNLCKVCDSGCVESVEHVLLHCDGYKGIRKEWMEEVKSIVGGGVEMSLPLHMMLGAKLISDVQGKLRVLLASTACL